MRPIERLVERVAAEIDRNAFRSRLDVFLSSREAARELTADRLRTAVGTDAIAGVAVGLASYADEGLRIVHEEFRPALDCREGCCYCCCKPGVLVSVPELVRILQVVAAAFTEAAVEELAGRARDYVTRLDGRDFNEPASGSFPCPLLIDGRCSVYEARPLVCRGYNSVNVEGCRRAHDELTASVPMFALLKDVTDGATVGAAEELRAAGANDVLVDLGTALSRALAAGPNAADAVIDGTVDLEGAENSRWVESLWAAVRAMAERVGVPV